jgi:hypothetical protein
MTVDRAEYYAGNLSDYNRHPNQAGSFVRVVMGCNNVKLLSLSGEYTFHSMSA